MSFPFVGLERTITMAQGARTGGSFQSQIGSTATSGIVAIVVIALSAITIGLMRRDALGWAIITRTPWEQVRDKSLAAMTEAKCADYDATAVEAEARLQPVTSPGSDLPPGR